MKLYFIRHGQCENNARGEHAILNDPGSPLTTLGTDQATQLGTYFANLGDINAIYTSPLVRCKATADAIALGNILEVDGLVERQRGVYGPKSRSTTKNALDAMSHQERYTTKPEGGESWKEMEQRLLRTLNKIVKNHELTDSIIIVTHKGCMRSLLPVILGGSSQEHQEYNTQVGSVTEVDYDGESFDLVRLSDTTYL